MCATCGCTGEDETHHARARGFARAPAGLHGRRQLQSTAPRTTLQLERSILQKSQRLADRNRAWLAARACVAFNLMGSPGAGKTALLEALTQTMPQFPLAVVEGDQATERDAERIRRAGCPAVQLNTGTGCHLDPSSVLRGLEALAPPPSSRIFFENVGNLVCPALFDLGEMARVVVLSVTEGDDKPLKYPHMFRACDAVVLSKIDLLAHVEFDVAHASEHLLALNPDVRIFQVAATRALGLAPLSDWLLSFEPGSVVVDELAPEISES